MSRWGGCNPPTDLGLMPSDDLHFLPGCSNGNHGAFPFDTLPGLGRNASQDWSVREQLSPVLQTRRLFNVMSRSWPSALVQKMILYLGPSPLAKVYDWKPLCLKMILYVGALPLAKVYD